MVTAGHKYNTCMEVGLRLEILPHNSMDCNRTTERVGYVQVSSEILLKCVTLLFDFQPRNNRYFYFSLTKNITADENFDPKNIELTPVCFRSNASRLGLNCQLDAEM